MFKLPPYRKPDFKNMAAVLEKKRPKRPVLFDFIINGRLEKNITGSLYDDSTEENSLKTRAKAFEMCGYDFAPVIVRGLTFNTNDVHSLGKATISLNEGAIITDRKSFDRYTFPEITACDFGIISRVGEILPRGMKLIPFSFDGVLENAVSLLGYENLCILLYEDRELVSDVFENVGKRLLGYFKKCLEYDVVGAILQNDDWGFKTQTMISPDDLRKYVFPWHKMMTEEAHRAGKYSVIHSCGHYGGIIDDITGYIKADGRHSYEDTIVPVEEAYGSLHKKIAVMGGIDVDFLAKSKPEAVYERCRAMVERSCNEGGYALGSGNSVPDYVPDENFFAMVNAAVKY